LEDGESGPEDEDDAAAVKEEELTPHDDADDGREVHDEAVLKTIRGQAIRLMKDKGVIIGQAEGKMALQLFPRVCSLLLVDNNTDDRLFKVADLARRLHDSTTLQEKFEKLIQDDPELDGGKTSLARHVPTHWNTDLTCLDAHVYLKSPVQQLTAAAVNNLQKYRLTDRQ